MRLDEIDINKEVTASIKPIIDKMLKVMILREISVFDPLGALKKIILTITGNIDKIPKIVPTLLLFKITISLHAYCISLFISLYA